MIVAVWLANFDAKDPQNSDIALRKTYVLANKKIFTAI